MVGPPTVTEALEHFLQDFLTMLNFLRCAGPWTGLNNNNK